jgi:hypothetical protein
MRPIDNSSFLTPDERLSEVAGILAVGVLRLHARAALPENELKPAQITDIPSQSGHACLDVSKKTVLSVHNG